MPLDWSQSGPGDVPSYQMSAVPFVTSSTATECNTTTPIRVKFPNATRFFIIHNIDAQGADDLRIGFTRNGVLGQGAHTGSSPGPNPGHFVADRQNYFLLPGGETTGRLEIRCKELFFLANANTAGFSIMAGLTPISNTMFPVLTGSAGYQGVG